MNVCGRYIALKERRLTHTPCSSHCSPVPVRSFVGTHWRTIPFHSNKIEDADKAELADAFQVSRTAVTAFLFPLSPSAVWCLCFNPQRAKCSFELLPVQHYRVPLTSSCSTFFLLQPCPPLFFFNLPLLFPLCLSLMVRRGIPVKQRAPSFLLPRSGVCSFETKA